jgi:hypothetical protein
MMGEGLAAVTHMDRPSIATGPWLQEEQNYQKERRHALITHVAD